MITNDDLAILHMDVIGTTLTVCLDETMFMVQL